MVNWYRTQNVFTTDDFSSRSDLTPSSDSFKPMLEKEFERGEAWIIGRGTKSNQVEAEGRLYMYLCDDSDSNQFTGKIRLAVYTKQDHFVDYVNTWDAEEIDEGASTRKDRIPLPIQSIGGDLGVGHPYKLVVEVKGSAGGNDLDPADGSFVIKIDGYELEQSG